MQETEYSEQNRIFSQVNVKDFLIRNDWKVLLMLEIINSYFFVVL